MKIVAISHNSKHAKMGHPGTKAEGVAHSGGTVETFFRGTRGTRPSFTGQLVRKDEFYESQMSKESRTQVGRG